MRTFIIAFSLLALVMLASPVLAAQDIMPPASWQATGPQAHAEQFLNLMIQGKLDDAFKALLGKTNSDKLDKLKFEIYRTYKKSGKPYSFEKILDQKAGTALMRMRYILLFKSLPMMFDFYYYNAGDDWRLRTFSYSVDVKKVFGE